MGIFKKKGKLSKVERRFLPILIQQSEYVKSAAATLCKMVETNSEDDWARCEREIKQFEVKGDAMLSEFYSTFYEIVIPSVHRDDLQTLSLDIDVFLDQINSAAKSLLLYKPVEIGAQYMDIARYIDSAATAIQQIIKDLYNIHANFSLITHQCGVITELEHATDEVYEEYIAELFEKEKDAITLVKNKNMAEVFEATTDAAKDFADNVRMFQLRFL